MRSGPDALCPCPADLLTIPPGFKRGVDFAPKGEFWDGRVEVVPFSCRTEMDGLGLPFCLAPQITQLRRLGCSASAVC